MSIVWQQNIDIGKVINNRIELGKVELGKAMQDHIALIQTRVASGKTFDNKSLGKYSKAYAKKRAASGRQTSPVNLNLTGSLMRSIDYRVFQEADGLTAEIFFRPTSSLPPKGFGKRGASSEQKAKRIISQGRQFFGISKTQVKNLRARVRRAMRKG